jgi:hypothetical protein
VQPIGYTWSYLACRIGRLVPIRRPGAAPHPRPHLRRCAWHLILPSAGTPSVTRTTESGWVLTSAPAGQAGDELAARVDALGGALLAGQAERGDASQRSDTKQAGAGLGAKRPKQKAGAKAGDAKAGREAKRGNASSSANKADGGKKGIPKKGAGAGAALPAAASDEGEPKPGSANEETVPAKAQPVLYFEEVAGQKVRCARTAVCVCVCALVSAGAFSLSALCCLCAACEGRPVETFDRLSRGVPRAECDGHHCFPSACMHVLLSQGVGFSKLQGTLLVLNFPSALRIPQRPRHATTMNGSHQGCQIGEMAFNGVRRHGRGLLLMSGFPEGCQTRSSVLLCAKQGEQCSRPFR